MAKGKKEQIKEGKGGEKMDVKEMKKVRNALEAGRPVIPIGFFLKMLRDARDMGLVKRTRHTDLPTTAEKGTEGEIWNCYIYSVPGLFVGLRRRISVHKTGDEPWAVERNRKAPFDPLDRKNKPGPVWDDLYLLIDGYSAPLIIIPESDRNFFPDGGENELAEYVADLFPPGVAYPCQLMSDELAEEPGVYDDTEERYDKESGRWVRCE